MELALGEAKARDGNKDVEVNMEEAMGGGEPNERSNLKDTRTSAFRWQGRE